MSLDLPEPQPYEQTPAQRSARRWRFLTTVNAILFAYALLHKLLVPIGVALLQQNLLSLTSSIDWWWPFHGLVAIALAKRSKPWIGRLAVLGSAYALGHMGLYTVETLNGAGKVSWSFISSAMTEGLGFVFLLFILTSSILDTRRTRWADQFVPGGVGLLLALVILPVPVSRQAAKVGGPAEHQAAQPSRAPETSDRCGANTATVSQEALAKAPQIHQVQILDCGFSVPLGRTTGDVEVMNTTDRFLNLQVHALSGTGPGRKWVLRSNLALFAGGRVTLHRDVWHEAPMLRLRSNSWQEAGISVLVNPAVAWEPIQVHHTGSE